MFIKCTHCIDCDIEIKRARQHLMSEQYVIKKVKWYKKGQQKRKGRARREKRQLCRPLTFCS